MDHFEKDSIGPGEVYKVDEQELNDKRTTLRNRKNMSGRGEREKEDDTTAEEILGAVAMDITTTTTTTTTKDDSDDDGGRVSSSSPNETWA